MRLSALGATAATLVALVVVPAGTAHAAPSCPAPGTMPGNAPPTTSFFERNNLLGPDPLPTGPIAAFLAGYQRFGDQAKPPMPEDTWKSTFITKRPETGLDVWIYPPKDGFVIKKDDTPDRHRTTLTPGTRLDRFGYAEGRFLAPPQTSFNQRALPPQALNTPNGYEPDYEGRINVSNAIVPPNNYHVYCVQNAFDVDTGPIAPWFNQAGLATQYVLVDGYVPDPNPRLDKNGKRLPNNFVRWLTGNGPNGSTGISNPYLVELVP